MNINNSEFCNQFYLIPIIYYSIFYKYNFRHWKIISWLKKEFFIKFLLWVFFFFYLKYIQKNLRYLINNQIFFLIKFVENEKKLIKQSMYKFNYFFFFIEISIIIQNNILILSNVVIMI